MTMELQKHFIELWGSQICFKFYNKIFHAKTQSKRGDNPWIFADEIRFLSGANGVCPPAFIRPRRGQTLVEVPIPPLPDLGEVECW